MTTAVLNSEEKSVTIVTRPVVMEGSLILVERHELEHEHRLLVERLHRLRKILGYAPIETGKQRRIAQAK